MSGCPSWSKGVDLRSTVVTLVGSNPTSDIQVFIQFPLHAPIAQLVERTAVNREVSGSNPLGSGPLHSPISGLDNVIYFTYKNVKLLMPLYLE